MPSLNWYVMTNNKKNEILMDKRTLSASYAFMTVAGVVHCRHNICSAFSAFPDHTFGYRWNFVYVPSVKVYI